MHPELRAGHGSPPSLLVTVAVACVGFGVTSCDSCRPDETLASLERPRKVRLVRKHDLGSQLTNRDHVVLEVDLATTQRVDVCENYEGSGELMMVSEGAGYAARCDGDWTIGRIVGGELFRDCAPTGSLQPGFALPALETHSPAMFGCVGELRQGAFLKALERELSVEQAAALLLGLTSPPREAWAARVLNASDSVRAEVLRTLCSVLRAPASDLATAARAATLCPIDDPSTWSSKELAPLALDASESASFVLEWTLLATMEREPALAGAIACGILEKDPTHAVAALVWDATEVSCPAARAALLREPPCGRGLDCDGDLCSKTEIDQRVEGARDKLIGVPTPRMTANWTSSAADGHAGHIVAPELLITAALTRKGPLSDELKRRNARRHYATPLPSKPGSLSACDRSTPPGAPCDCSQLGNPELDRCGDARWRDALEVDACELTVDDEKRAILGAVGLRK